MSTSLGIVFITIFLQTCSFLPANESVIYLKGGKSSELTQAQNNQVREIAKQVTVRVLTEPGAGSGVIISRKGKTYTVLTCQHVVAESKDNKYSVMSADGKTHPARLKYLPELRGLDLAVLEFDSENSYQVVELGNSNILSAGSVVYAAGFPNYNDIDKNNIEETFAWGTKAFQLTQGKVNLLLAKHSLPEGYSLGYTNEIKLGMSGGPVLDDKGELVGINGRLKYPIQGIDVFTFADGTKPSVEEFEKMEALSWAIPIVKFRALAE
ncbi:MAG: trypsin-like peptidase domain-containing protein [Richelia sp. RM2_1_2]|nr:trypsin-like peptidase domain-containing protein [Richelia sp. RM2_1_2]